MTQTDTKAIAFEMRCKGLTYRQIGEQLGISRQRAQQLVKPPQAIYEHVRQKSGGRCETCHVETDTGHVHHVQAKGATPDNYNDLTNLQYLCVSCHRRAHDGDNFNSTPCEVCGNPRYSSRCFTCNPVNRAAAELGKRRWANIPAEQRSQLVPRSGGRPKIKNL